MSEKGLSWLNMLKMYDRVPLKMPSTLRMRSPVSIKCFKVAMTGSPAPTVAYIHIDRTMLQMFQGGYQRKPYSYCGLLEGS